jgi:hypothetical protein
MSVSGRVDLGARPLAESNSQVGALQDRHREARSDEAIQGGCDDARSLRLPRSQDRSRAV